MPASAPAREGTLGWTSISWARASGAESRARAAAQDLLTWSSVKINSGFGQALGPGQLVEQTAGGFAEDPAVSASEEGTAQAPMAQDRCLQSVNTLHHCILPLQPLGAPSSPALELQQCWGWGCRAPIYGLCLPITT